MEQWLFPSSGTQSGMASSWIWQLPRLLPIGQAWVSDIGRKQGSLLPPIFTSVSLIPTVLPIPHPRNGAGVEAPTHLKLFRVKLVDRWVSGPGSHWQVRLSVVRFMRQDRLWGVEGGSVRRVGRMRALGRTTQKAPTGTNWLVSLLWVIPSGLTWFICLSAQPRGKPSHMHVQGQASQSLKPPQLHPL